MSTYASVTDMMTGEPATVPETFLATASCLDMGHYYGLPITGGGIFGSKYGVMDAEAGWDQGSSGLLTMLLQSNTYIELGGTSLHVMVRADEGLGMLKALMKGVDVSDETLAIDVTRDIGPGAGTFLGHEHTFRHFNEHWRPSLFPEGSTRIGTPPGGRRPLTTPGSASARFWPRTDPSRYRRRQRRR